mmetsp:Transcript_2607/g.10306  ORF Transcript_2607/g.10306 Transcript_2607/m.10306 type:complete len:216 (-) Transcript_2607:471-1118(-)
MGTGKAIEGTSLLLLPCVFPGEPGDVSGRDACSNASAFPAGFLKGEPCGVSGGAARGVPKASFSVSSSSPAASARSCASMPLCRAFMSARISAFSSRSSASSRIASACLSSSSVCFACSASTRSASKRQRSASAAARSPSDWNPRSISSAMFARRVAPASSVCRRDIFWTRCNASTALCSSIARMRSSSSSSCAADASCAAHSASKSTSRCFISV